MAIWQPRRLEERGYVLPPLIKPEGPGFMPLYCAAQWIATREGTVEIDPLDEAIWRAAYKELLDRLASEDIKVVGIKGGVSEQVRGVHFASCPVDYPFSDASLESMLSEELHLVSYPYIDDEHWRNGFDDSLEDRRGAKWKRLAVLKSDVKRCWEFGAIASDDPPMKRRSGAPGRPSSMDLVEVEYRARWARGEVQERIGNEAKALSHWLSIAHPGEPKLTAKSIRNRLGSEHRKRLAGAQK